MHGRAGSLSMQRGDATRWVAVVLAGATAIRLAWVLLVPNGQYSDSVWYDGAAANLAAYGVYGLQGPSAWFPPGYPFLLAAIYRIVGHSEIAGKLANVALGVGLCFGTYRLARMVAGQTVGLIAAAIIAVWPNLIFHTGILSSDLLAACGFVFVLWLATRPVHQRPLSWVRAIVLGVLIGWLILVRPVSLILLPSIALWWFLTSRSLSTTVLRVAPIVAIAAVAVSAWTIRNYVEFGEVITIATNGGYNFWQTNHRFADGNDTYWAFVPMDDPEYQTMSSGDEFTKNREGYRYALAYLRANPGHLLAMLPTKIFWLYHTDTSGFYEGALNPPMNGPSVVAKWIADHERLTESLTFRYYEVVVALAVVGALVAIWRGESTWVWPMLTLPLLLTLFHMFFHAKDRFHIPLAGPIAVLAALTLAEVSNVALRWISERRLNMSAH